MGKEHITTPSGIEFSTDVLPLTSSNLRLAETVPTRMSSLLDHLKTNVQAGLIEMNNRGDNMYIAGPEWCRSNSVDAGRLHAEVIIKTYGDTYALPNKDPEANTQALNSGDLDMFLLFKDGLPVGTACMVAEQHGLGELGRSASLGRVGNRVIQDMRIIKWLTDEETASKFHTLFATCRTAPDRNIGTEINPEIMRGGQAVSHMWEKMPDVKVGGFGPLYKKHGALEQFAYTFITKGDINKPDDIWVYKKGDLDFVASWLREYGLTDDFQNHGLDQDNNETSLPKVHVEYAPHETGITELVHGEIELGDGDLSLTDGISTLSETGVPFMQMRVPIDQNTLAIQKQLLDEGFQVFQFTPGLTNIQSPMLWFGKLNKGVPVVPTFWDNDGNIPNPFWHGELARYATKVARNW